MVLTRPPKKLKKNVTVMKVPDIKEPRTVRSIDITTASFVPKFMITYKLTILASPSLKPGTNKSVGIGINVSKMCKPRARPVVSPR